MLDYLDGSVNVFKNFPVEKLEDESEDPIENFVSEKFGLDNTQWLTTDKPFKYHESPAPKGYTRIHPEHGPSFLVSNEVAAIFDKPLRDPCKYCHQKHAEYACDHQIQHILRFAKGEEETLHL